jgi:hypothetical protein
MPDRFRSAGRPTKRFSQEALVGFTLKSMILAARKMVGLNDSWLKSILVASILKTNMGLRLFRCGHWLLGINNVVR